MHSLLDGGRRATGPDGGPVTRPNGEPVHSIGESTAFSSIEKAYGDDLLEQAEVALGAGAESVQAVTKVLDRMLAAIEATGSSEDFPVGPWRSLWLARDLHRLQEKGGHLDTLPPSPAQCSEMALRYPVATRDQPREDDGQAGAEPR